MGRSPETLGSNAFVARRQNRLTLQESPMNAKLLPQLLSPRLALLEVLEELVE
jgi:hypothetical protein